MPNDPANGGRQLIERHADGSFANTDPNFAAVYAEIKRLDQLRGADQKAVDAALVAAEKAVAAALIAAKEAVNKAEVAQQRTNESQNEFRGQLRDQAATFLTRGEWDLSHKALNDKLAVTNDDLSLLRSRMDVGSPELSALRTRSDRDEGRNSGGRETWQIVVILVAAVMGVGGFMVSLAVALSQ